jgi:hypothetical protein
MPVKFTRQNISSETFETAGVWDVNGDGILDIVSGGFWYQGPDFQKQHRICDVSRLGEYWNDFSTLPLDINGDGRLGVVTGGWGGGFCWRECPQDPTQEWPVHSLGDIGHIETMRAVDIDGDGVPEIIPNTPAAPCRILKLQRDGQGRGRGRFECYQVSDQPMGHGLGFGDMNGDGRLDIILKNGWLEQPKGGLHSQPWKFHPEFDLGPYPSIPILCEDVNGDGVRELITGTAHGYGLDWWQPVREGNGVRRWIRHPIDPCCSQYHDLVWCDIDGDGQKELVTGKRYRAHCGSDPGEFDDIGVYYFKWTGEGFAKQVIAHGAFGIGKGLGIHFAVADLRGTGRLDIIAPGKDGLAVFFNEGSR